MKYRWLPAPEQLLLAGQLARQLRISPLLAQCLVNRHFDDPQLIEGFLEPRLKHLADPFLIPNMADAVERLLIARERNEQVVIFGDYDVDAVASTALLFDLLPAFGCQVDCPLRIPLPEPYAPPL